MQKNKILITGRDFGAAVNLAPIIQRLLSNEKFEVEVAAQEQALSYFKSVLEFDVLEVNSRELEVFSRSVKNKYDIILTGLSGFDFGIDEVVLKERGSAVAFCLQDFWGDVNESLKSFADYYFVIDKMAAELTYEKTGKPSIILQGLPKFVNYKNIFTDSLNKKKGSKLKITYIGQPLWQFKGYFKTLKVISEMFSNDSNFEFSYKCHPSESQEDLVRLEQLNITCEVKMMHEVLLTSDITLSVNSTCVMDFAYLNKFSREPIGLHAFTLFDKELRHFFYKGFGLRSHPMVKMGVVTEYLNPHCFQKGIVNALASDNFQKNAWKNSSFFKNAEKILDLIEDVLVREIS